ncbi:MAG TPA: ABC transporter substrate-binding protein, partial [Dehalococcoidia bacterium]|nr:ABC transporter substrate-binding protein [Dehalococcoidia bacterium]
MSGSGDQNYWQRLAGGQVTRRRLLHGGAVTGLGLAAAGIVGCGSSNNNKATKSNGAAPAASSASATATRAAATGTPSAAASGGSPAAASAASVPTAQAGTKTGGTIQSVIVGTANLDPVENTTYRSQWISGFHYARLFRFAASADPKVTSARTPVPDLVEKYELGSDGTQYTMHLRPGVMFHPPLNRALTSADVLASWDYFNNDPKNTNNTVYKPIVDSLTAPDNNTLVFKLKAPYAPFLNKLANTQYLWIMSKDAVDKKIDPAQQAVGVGPWIFDSSTPTAFTWKKN